MFSCSFSRCPSARRVSAANSFPKSTDISRNLRLSINNLNLFHFSFFPCVYFIAAAAVVCIRADSVIGHWLLNSARV
jgi:hypothetical protein